MGNTSCKVLRDNKDMIFECAIADSFFTKLLGLMFKRSFPYKALLFRDCYWMHSFCCLVNFHIVFLDENFNVLKTFYDVKPNKILPPIFKSRYVIEFFDSSIKFKTGEKIIVEGL